MIWVPVILIFKHTRVPQPIKFIAEFYAAIICLMVKSLSCCCVCGSLLFSNPVINYIMTITTQLYGCTAMQIIILTCLLSSPTCC